MKKIRDLFMPSHDAIDYNNRDKKNLFLKMYNCTSHFKRLKEQNCFFIIGDKGSGKTVLALYYQLNSPDNSISKLLSISATQYKQFIALKKARKLDYTDYTSIWRATLLMLMSQLIIQKTKKWIHKLTKKFSKIENAVLQYDEEALLPQLNTAIELATKLSASENAGVNADFFSVKANNEINTFTKENYEAIRFYINESEKKLKEGLSDIKLDNDFILFLDGLDARPADVEKKEFDDCLQGLYDALWQLDTEFFPMIRDSKGRMRICLLVRPDIFESLNVYNSNSRVSDNAVYLNWLTTEKEYKSQPLFRTMNKYFISQNGDDEYCGWDKYFSESDDFFSNLLKTTFIRPRDYFSALGILVKHYKDIDDGSDFFSSKSVSGDFFRREMSDYMLGEVKNYMNFYISNKDYAEYIKFFDFINGKTTFSWFEYMEFYKSFKNYIDNSNVTNKEFCETPIKLLQFFYDSNLIGFFQQPNDGSKKFVYWSYREKTLNNLCPKIKENCKYIVFEGVRKALNIGKSFK